MPTLTTSAQPFAKQMRGVSVPGQKKPLLTSLSFGKEQSQFWISLGKPSGKTLNVEEGQSQKLRQSTEKLIPWGLKCISIPSLLACCPA